MKTFTSLFLTFIMATLIDGGSAMAQNPGDTSNLPKISIQSVNGFGPYLIGTKRTNFFIADSLPPNTSKITFRMIDSEGVQFNSGHTDEGNNLQMSFWQFESDTMDFPISPKLNVEVVYQEDSIANYYIPYIVEAMPITFEATAGWGPFISNDYQLSDTSWQPLPEQENTFKASVLPPRTDTVKFTIYSLDSTVIQQHVLTGEKGLYVDSASYEDVRMDQLPLSTGRIDLAAICEGGPSGGYRVSRDLHIILQKPQLMCKTKEQALLDSIPLIVADYDYGQALSIDTNKYVDILNGPGRILHEINGPHYAGPYSFDIIEDDFSIEAWYQFNNEVLASGSGQMTVMTIDSLWGIMFHCADTKSGVVLLFKSFAGNEPLLLFSAYLDIDTTSWNHVALTCHRSTDKKGHDIKVYLNGIPVEVIINTRNYDYITNNINVADFRKTKHLRIGGSGVTPFNNQIVEAVDEIRIWDYQRTGEQIKENYNCSVLQDYGLLGYWNFNDRRNRLKKISDLSFYNNTGMLENGCHFIPQNKIIEYFPDTLRLISSNIETDSVVFNFYDNDKTLVLSKTETAENGVANLSYNLSELPHSVNKLLVNEYYPGTSENGHQSSYQMLIYPHKPMATPKYNWSTFYQSDEPTDQIYNEILVSNLPDDVYKVEVGLGKGDTLYDQMVFTQNSTPYQYAIQLNGTDNYIETSETVKAPATGSVSLWFKSTSGDGAKLMGFGTTQNGINSTRNERELLLEKDGSLRFYVNEHTTLYALHAYNDGEWHNVEANWGAAIADLYVDGSMVDTKATANIEAFDGYWTLGRMHENSTPGYRNLAEYYEGFLVEVDIISEDNDNYHINMKMNDGSGNIIKDHSGNNNGIVIGSEQKWLTVPDKISFVSWRGNMVTKDTGMYNAYAKIFYNDGPVEGAFYKLGRFSIRNPINDCFFAYNINRGLGYFNEGTQLINTIQISTDYANSIPSDDDEYYVRCAFVTPENLLISSEINTYTDPLHLLNYNIDMGDAPVGSYLVFDYGFMENNEPTIRGYFSMPIYIHQMIAPTVNVNTGPFLQAIAPGTMAQPNTVIVTTEHFDDLNRVLGKFYNKKGILVAQQDGVEINDTTWNIIQNMGPLPPPGVNLKIEYYLGPNPNPALVEGPYYIAIHKTRPRWFDFLADTSFHDISETNDTVKFSLLTYLTTNHRGRNISSYSIPKAVPFLGGISISNNSPGMNAYLKYIKANDSLIIGEVPKFRQAALGFQFGSPLLVQANFKITGSDTYYLDANNNLVAMQNVAAYGDITKSMNLLMEKPLKKFLELYKTLRLKDWKNLKPMGFTFNLNISPTVGYATRLNYKYDTINRRWGSFGNLDIDANPNHIEPYSHSASYNFAYLGLNMKFAGGLTVGAGLADVFAGISMGFYVGLGRTYISIPNFQDKWKSTGNMELSFRAWIEVLWGWYEYDFYGPKVLTHLTLPGDDMSNCYPPFEDKTITKFCNTNDVCLADSLLQFNPVGWYHKMPLPKPGISIDENEFNHAYSWLEPGNKYGERKLCMRLFDTGNMKFSDKMVVASNSNAIHKPKLTMMDKRYALAVWMQSRHNPETILEVGDDDFIEELVGSFDIWYAIYDTETQIAVKMDQVDDDVSALASGRPEGDPVVALLSDDRALLVWKVGNLEEETTSLWYAIISGEGDQWVITDPVPFENQGGVITNIKLASVEEGKAALVWKYFEPEVYEQNSLYSALFDTDAWHETVEIFTPDSSLHYNYFDLDFSGDYGAMVYSTYTYDRSDEEPEKIYLVKWDAMSDSWDLGSNELLFASDDQHIQLPNLTLGDDGEALVGYKLSLLGELKANKKMSQLNLMRGTLSNTGNTWNEITADPLICDTTKEIGHLDFVFAGGDTLLILSQEYLMTATNAPYTPINGVSFGDDRMNIVLRTVKVSDQGAIEDVSEGIFFTDIPEPISYYDASLEQNVPNPCRNNTRIRFYLPTGGHAILEVFDLNGSKLGTLVNRRLQPGYWESVMNTSSLKPGTYVVQLVFGNSKKSIKMIVNR